MSYFGSERMTGEQIFNEDSKSDMSPLKVAISANGYRDTFKYWSSAEEMMCVSYKYGVVVSMIRRQFCNGKGVAGIRSLYEAIRKVQPFVGREGIMHDLTNNIIPALQEAGIVCLIGDKIYVNPALVGMDERDVYTWQQMKRRRNNYGNCTD